jgi:hypothetical protein
VGRTLRLSLPRDALLQPGHCGATHAEETPQPVQKDPKTQHYTIATQLS